MATKRELEIELRDLRARVGEAELGEHIYSKQLDENAYTIRRLRDERAALRGKLAAAERRLAEVLGWLKRALKCVSHADDCTYECYEDEGGETHERNCTCGCAFFVRQTSALLREAPDGKD